MAAAAQPLSSSLLPQLVSPHFHQCCFTLCFPLAALTVTQHFGHFFLEHTCNVFSLSMLQMHNEGIPTHKLIQYQPKTERVCRAYLRVNTHLQIYKLKISSKLARAKPVTVGSKAFWHLYNVTFAKLNHKEKWLFFYMQKHITRRTSCFLFLLIRILTSDCAWPKLACEWFSLWNVSVWCCLNQLRNWFLSFCLLYPTNHWRKEQGETSYRFVQTYTFSTFTDTDYLVGLMSIITVFAVSRIHTVAWNCCAAQSKFPLNRKLSRTEHLAEKI